MCFLLFFTGMLYGSEKDAISNFLKTLKTSDDIKQCISMDSMVSYESFSKEDFQKRVYLIFYSMTNMTIEEFKKNAPDENRYNNITVKRSISVDLRSVDCKLFEFPFEYKKLKDGRILLLFDDSQKKLKIPMILISKGGSFLIDVLSLRLLRYANSYNNAKTETSMEIVPLLFRENDLFTLRDLDHSYMLAFDVFYDSEERDVNFSSVLFGALYKEVLIESGRKLLDKNSKMSEKERKLRALQFYYVKEYLKDPIVKEAEAAYAVAEEIYKKMDEKEIKLYTQRGQ